MTMQTVSYKRGYIHYTTTGNDTKIEAQNDAGERKVCVSERQAKEWLNQYNGHKNWNYWNVSLWINNDEALYNLALSKVKSHRTKDDAAREMFITLKHFPGECKTPDGAPYSVSSIRAAMVDM